MHNENDAKCSGGLSKSKEPLVITQTRRFEKNVKFKMLDQIKNSWPKLKTKIVKYKLWEETMNIS